MRLSFILFALSASLLAQTAALRGVVTDETGAVLPSAKVTVDGPAGVKTTAAGGDGSYIFTGLAPGDYTVQASAPDLALPRPVKVALGSGIQTLNLQLKVAATVQQLTVDENAATAVTTDAASNASAVTLKGSDLDALADDPEDLQADLQALAGPSAGPGGGSIFIDGFSGGQLPAKESIREIRINQNPFSPEYDRIGFGRIEILTKPGADKLRGSAAYNFMGDGWNTRNPYAAEKAPLLLNEYRANLSGPLNGRTSFTLDGSRENVDNGSIVNAVIVERPSLAVRPFTAVPVSPQRRTQISPRADYQLNPNNTLTFRYMFLRNDVDDAGIGSFDLASRGYRIGNTNHSVQATETAVFGASVNETRFQYNRSFTETAPNLESAAIQVLGSVNEGGAQVGLSFNTQNNYELQNYTTVVHGSHVVKFGVRARVQSIDSVSRQNFNGTFTFGGGSGIQLIDRYRQALLSGSGSGATQFSFTRGIPEISGNQTDVGAFIGDDWRVLPNLTLNLGARYETQTNIHDWRDWIPRAGLAWAPGGSAKRQPKTVLRAGFGLFYDRFSLFNTLTARRFNGIVQQQYVVTNPNFFPNLPTDSDLATATQVIQKVDPGLHAPYIMQSAFTVERQLPKGSTLAVTYSNSRGLHLLRSLDGNAPLRGVFPLGNPNPLFLMTSSGVYRQNQLMASVNSRLSRKVSLTGTYVWNRAESNTDGLGTFPANPYDYAGEYGPAATDIHHRVNLSGSINAKWNIQLSPLLSVQSGPPFDITTGSDVYGTTLFNARPGFASDPGKAGLIQTQYGLLDPDPSGDEKLVPRNYGRGPGQILLNLRMSKTFGFGPDRGGRGGGSGGNAAANRRYGLLLYLSVRNVLNHTNAGPIIGNITSPLFGQANQMGGGFGFGGGQGAGGPMGGVNFSENANNRRLEMQVRFTF